MAINKIETVKEEGNDRLALFCSYDTKLVKKIKSLDWKTSHYQFNRSLGAWTFDLTKEVIMKLQNLFEIKIDYSFYEQAYATKVKLIRGGNFYFIKNYYKLDEKKLRHVLSFKVQGAEWSEPFIRGNWDGRKSLLIHKDKAFPIGLIDIVTRFLEKEKIRYQIIEKEQATSKKCNFSWNSPYILRDYQEEVAEKAIEKKRGIINIPTGGGKTFIANTIINHVMKKTVIFVHTKELLDQWKKCIKRDFGFNPGIVGDGEEEFSEKITVIMLQTAANRDLKKFYADVGFVIFDEVHHCPSDTYYKVFQQVPTENRIGLSATPFREDGKDLMIKAGTGEFIYDLEPRDLIKRGWLAPVEYQSISGFDIPGASWPDVHKNLINCNERNLRIKNLVEEYKQTKILISVKRILHGQILEDMIDGAIFLSGEDKSEKRERVLEEFKKGERNILISTLLGEGVNIPCLQTLIIADGGKSEVQYIQLVGRALRLHRNKEKATVIDFYDKGRYLKKHSITRINYINKYFT